MLLEPPRLALDVSVQSTHPVHHRHSLPGSLYWVSTAASVAAASAAAGRAVQRIGSCSPATQLPRSTTHKVGQQPCYSVGRDRVLGVVPEDVGASAAGVGVDSDPRRCAAQMIAD